ncbi:hypothetical protein P4E94_04690 [Pontiellaceae bacterium B12219]|nr:hypothetical protein [Pontiellaceae bacterium B12219]
MHRTVLFLLVAALVRTLPAQEALRTFSNAEGKTISDRIVKYDFEEKEVTLEKAGKHPIDSFSEADQAYILHWNQIQGFKSSMRFKTEIKKGSWARMKYEQNITPYYMDAIGIPGKKTPNHHIIMVDGYKEYNAIYLEAEGYELKIRNQNIFPLENLIVESKIFYEQERYILPDDFYYSDDRDYDETVLTNKVRYSSETIPVIIPREDVFIQSECAVVVDQQIERSALPNRSSSGETDTDATIEGFGEWGDHGRRRKGRVHGVWFRIGMKDPDGNMVWREDTAPSSLIRKFTWQEEILDTNSLPVEVEAPTPETEL